MQSTFIVKREDNSVDLAFNRLKTLLQIKRSTIDKIETELFSVELNSNGKRIFSNLRICEISPLFMNKLGLQLPEAQKFARFLVEEPDENAEENRDNAKIVYYPNRKANL